MIGVALLIAFAWVAINTSALVVLLLLARRER